MLLGPAEQPVSNSAMVKNEAILRKVLLSFELVKFMFGISFLGQVEPARLRWRF